jgi:hypothetical protein
MSEQWWLARLDQYGNPTLCDGAHSTREGVERALYLIKGLRLDRGDRYAAVHLFVSDVEPKAHGANEEAIAILTGALPHSPSKTED